MAFGFGFGMPRIFSASRAFSPASFFANGEQGWWFDPSNFATLFQDSAGTTPVTAVEQPVGLQLDLSKGLVLGSEILTNGTFDSSIAGWTAGAGSAAWVAGTAQITGSSGVIARLYQGMTLTAGQWYRMTATCVSTTDASATFEFLGGSVSTTFTAGQTKSLYFSPASTGTFYAQVRNTNAGSVVSSFDNISVQSLAGNHRFQTTSANRPVVSARVNLLTKTEQFDDAVWVKSNATITSNATAAPDGTLTADLLIENTANSTHNIINNVTFPTISSGTLHAVTWRLKPAGRTVVYVQASAAGTGYGGAFITLTGSGTVSNYFNGISSGVSVSVLNDGWYLITLSFTANTTQGIVVVGLSNAAGTQSYTGDGTSGIFIWGADLRPTNQGVGLPAYQRVNTSTDYDSTGFPVYIKPNGSNQFMQTNSINFTATDKMTVWQGVRKVDNGGRFIYELSAGVNVNNGAFALEQFGDAKIYATSRGTLTSELPTGVLSTTLTAVVTNQTDISAPLNRLRLNGAQVAQNANTQGTGNYGNYPAYFYMRGGSSLPFNGHDYGSIARGAASTAAQITNGETYINSLTKAYAP